MKNDLEEAERLNQKVIRLYQEGRYEDAIPHAERALALREKAIGPEHSNVATSLNNLAGLYRAQGRYADAEPRCLRALSINEKSLGENHPDVATSLNNLALLYKVQGRYADAEPLYRRALAIWEKTLGKDHPDVATSLNNLAELYCARGRYADAEPLYLHALAIREKALGKDHPDVATSLNSLSAFYASLALHKAMPERHSDSHSCFKRADEINEKVIEDVFTMLSERQKMEYIGILEGDMNAFLSHTAQYLKDDSEACRDALDVWLRWKGTVTEAQSRHREALFHSEDPEVEKTHEGLKKIKGQISNLTFSGLGMKTPEEYKVRRDILKELDGKKDELEAKLSRLSKEYSIERQVGRADSKSISEALSRLNNPPSPLSVKGGWGD
ncbi:MAG: hypothetical protein SCARUB_02941 [Candidatus Scalindua rubra]|uniref:Uncharacterized protein n=1 Tax=Candidatus Scalindua rubra TaxID=1872076 RepID=A0A1E3X8K6_9BACT|nr:MAG: hypothetical protein SCARUB_02941 [Candidatus Scalindua rubra]